MDVITAHNKKREYDFIFVCESKVRELESCCLIGQELENRGYSVGIINWWMPQIYLDYEPVSAKVLMSHAVYKDESLNRELSYVKGKTKVINMQWEQIYSEKELTSNVSPWKMEGNVKKVIHLSWGKENHDKLVNYDSIPEENIKVVGAVSMDFLNPKLNGYFLSREELYERYKIPTDKKVCLFISSFSLVDLPKISQEPEFREFQELQVKSHREIIDWIDRLLNVKKDITFIYRPHPAEANNPAVLDLEKKYSNFRCIRDLSVKQWIITSDVIYNWFSTSISEVYFAKKTCYMLRPYDIRSEIECLILKDGNYITKYEEFIKTFDDIEPEFPIPERNIRYTYCNNEDKLVYLNIADVAEETIVADCCSFTAPEMYQNKDIAKYKLKKTKVGKLIVSIKHFIERIDNSNEEKKNNDEYKHYVEEMYENNNFTQSEIEKILGRIDRALSNSIQ